MLPRSVAIRMIVILILLFYNGPSWSVTTKVECSGSINLSRCNEDLPLGAPKDVVDSYLLSEDMLPGGSLSNLPVATASSLFSRHLIKNYRIHS